MTLRELANTCWAMPKSKLPVKIHIFESEESAEEYINFAYYDKKNPDLLFIATHCSDMKIDYTLSKELCNANVIHFFATETDTLIVIIDREDCEEYSEKEKGAKDTYEDIPTLTPIDY